jgi:hypothetical protein
MRVLILNTDYEAFLDDLYAENPGLAEESYDQQMVVRNRSLFGVADFYSEGLKANGVEAADIHLNNRAMQLRWAAEHGVNIDGKDRSSRNSARGCGGCSVERTGRRLSSPPCLAGRGTL